MTNTTATAPTLHHTQQLSVTDLLQLLLLLAQVVVDPYALVGDLHPHQHPIEVIVGEELG